MILEPSRLIVVIVAKTLQLWIISFTVIDTVDEKLIKEEEQAQCDEGCNVSEEVYNQHGRYFKAMQSGLGSLLGVLGSLSHLYDCLEAVHAYGMDLRLVNLHSLNASAGAVVIDKSDDI